MYASDVTKRYYCSAGKTDIWMTGTVHELDELYICSSADLLK
jgi:hypothetical protein